jgi:hypothetical protein
MFTQFERDKEAGVGVMFEDFITAVGMMVYTNERTVTVSDLALAFNTTPELVREAAEAHPWLLVRDDGSIESDGE